MKVYVDEIPESCGDCKFLEKAEYSFYCSRLNIKLNYIDREKDCPLQSLKDHDRELVRQVCEKINNLANKKANIDTGMLDMVYFDNIVEKIEKEYER